MTEEELTQMALLKAQADKLKENREPVNIKATQETQATQETPKPQETKKTEVENIQETENTEETKVEEQKEFPETIVLGPNKSINYKLWTGKTRRSFTSLLKDIENPDELDTEDALEILLYDNLEGDPYLTDIEEQRILLEIRRKSIDTMFEVTGTCEKCGTQEIFIKDINEIYHFTENTFPGEKNGVKFKDIPTRSMLIQETRKIMDDIYYDGITNETDVEIALHIDNGKDTKQTLEWIDDLPILKLKQVMEDLSSFAPQMEPWVEHDCSKCKTKTKYWTENLPDIFEEILI